MHWSSCLSPLLTWSVGCPFFHQAREYGRLQWLKKMALAFGIIHLWVRRKPMCRLNVEDAAAPIQSGGSSGTASRLAHDDVVQPETRVLHPPSPSLSPPASMHYCPYYLLALQLHSRPAIKAKLPKRLRPRFCSCTGSMTQNEHLRRIIIIKWRHVDGTRPNLPFWETPSAWIARQLSF